MVVSSEVEGLVVVTSVVLGRVFVVLVVGTVVALTVFSSCAPVLIATFVVGDLSVVIASEAVVDFTVVIAVFVISCSLLFNADVGGLVGGVGVVTSSHSCSKHSSSVIGLSSLLHHFAFGSSFESAKHLTFRLRIPTPQVLEHDSQG